MIKYWNKAQLSLVEKFTGITVNNIRLGASEKDRSLFSQGLVLLREAEDALPNEVAKEQFRSSMQTIADADGNIHTMTVTELRSLLVQYGLAYQELWVRSKSNVQ